MKKKILSKNSMLRNIMGLSKGDRAYCGPYGTVTCTQSAAESKSGNRVFSVSGSQKLVNRGNWNTKQLREAINA